MKTKYDLVERRRQLKELMESATDESTKKIYMARIAFLDAILKAFDKFEGLPEKVRESVWEYSIDVFVTDLSRKPEVLAVLSPEIEWLKG